MHLEIVPLLRVPAGSEKKEGGGGGEGERIFRDAIRSQSWQLWQNLCNARLLVSAKFIIPIKIYQPMKNVKRVNKINIIERKTSICIQSH